MSRYQTQANVALLYAILAAALIAYLLPWATAPSAPLILNAYDLAEFVSLHPAQRGTSPPLLATLLLRVQLAIICVSFALISAGRPGRLWRALVILALTIAQLPPPEFALDPGNLNYRQQLGLALSSLGIGLVLLRLGGARLRQLTRLSLPLFGIIGMTSSYAGLAQALDVYAQLDMAGGVGLGFWLLMLCYAGLILTAILARNPGANNR